MFTQNAENGGPSAGALFWLYFAKGQLAPSSEGGGPGGRYGVFSADSTFDIIRNFTVAMKDLSYKPVPGCAAGVVSAASMPSAPNCSHTYVNGRPGTGYENERVNNNMFVLIMVLNNRSRRS